MRITARLAKAMYDFTGKHILITGGSSGIGKAVAAEVAKRGGNVTLLARNQTRLGEAKQFIESKGHGTKISTVAADVAGKYEDVETAIRKAEEGLGPVDVLVNSAGISVAQRFEDTPIEDFKRVMDINVLGSAQASRAVVPHMKAREDGRIVFVASLAGVVGVYGYTAYCASKFAVRGFAEALFQEVKAHNVKVIVTNPPDVDTPMLEGENATRPEETKQIAGTAAMKKPEEVAGSIVDNIASGAFMGYQGFDGWMLTTVSSGLAPIPSLGQAILQVLFMSPLRLVGFIYQATFDKIIYKCKKENDAKKNQ